MPRHPRPVPRSSRRQRRATPALVALCAVAACVTLAACGSSGGGSSSSAKGSTSATGPGRAGSGRFTQLRSCLQKAGITLPAPPAGATPGSGAPGAAGSNGRRRLQLPKGVTQSQFRAALKKCGGGAFGRGRVGAFNSPAARAGLVKFAACLRQNGIDVPAPNTTGKGPVFSTKGIDTSSSKFKAAESKCRSNLKGAFAPGAGAGAPPVGAQAAAPPNGAPPAGAGAPPLGEGPG